MKWRNKGSSENSAVIWSFKGGKAGEDIVVTTKVRRATCDADSIFAVRYLGIKNFCHVVDVFNICDLAYFA